MVRKNLGSGDRVTVISQGMLHTRRMTEGRTGCVEGVGEEKALRG